VSISRRTEPLEWIAASKRTASTAVGLRIPEADLALSRKQAEQQGLPYQTYIKSLLHETLAEREKRKVGQKVQGAALAGPLSEGERIS
jgi:hypothetical protein